MAAESFVQLFDECIPDDLCNTLIAEYEVLASTSAENLKYGVYEGDKTNGGVIARKDTAYFFERERPQLSSEVHKYLNTMFDKYVDVFPSAGVVPMYSNMCKVQKTPPKGGFHQWHCERGASINDPRVLVWMIYLNDCAEGEGTTEFLEQGLRIQPKKGTGVLFPADWTHMHRGNPVYTSDKYIATGWFYLQI